MLPLAKIKVKAAKVRRAKSQGAPKIVPADPDCSYFTRNVPAIIKKTQQRIAETEIPVMDHFYSILSKSKIGRQSAYGEHLCFMYAQKSMKDHDYTEPVISPPNVTVIPKPNLSQLSNEVVQYHLSPMTIVDQDELPLTVLTCEPSMYKTGDCFDMEMSIQSKLSSSNSVIEIDLMSLRAPKPSGANYVSCIQKSDIWQAIRKKKITGSRLPALLGFYGREKYEHYWDVVKNGVPEKDLSHIINIRRGITFEDEAIAYFENLSGSITEKVGFFMHL
jgi:hypothetical protein